MAMFQFFRRHPLWVLLLAALIWPDAALAQSAATIEAARNRMVDEEIVAAGVTSPRVIEAMRKTPRHEFAPLAERRYAYLDMALPIGFGQTISAPFIVAYMTEQLDPQPSDRVLEIGTGSGYQAAVLSSLVAEVYTIEIVEPLGKRAERVLRKYGNVHVKIGDGYQGWPEHAPFDKIIVTCSPESVPQPLSHQLKEGGRMIIPLGERYQQTFHLLKKQDGKLVTEALRPALFVPMTGKAEESRQVQPDPTRPAIRNGDFEEVFEGTSEPSAWHYQRQIELVAGADAPSSKQYVRFKNADPGRASQALQGFPVDGRQVSQLQVSLQVRGDDIRPGQSGLQLPAVVITFYDSNRGTIGEAIVGPWRGTFPWQAQTALVRVSREAREAIVRIGLQGATGELSIDDLRIERPGGK